MPRRFASAFRLKKRRGVLPDVAVESDAEGGRSSHPLHSSSCGGSGSSSGNASSAPHIWGSSSSTVSHHSHHVSSPLASPHLHHAGGMLPPTGTSGGHSRPSTSRSTRSRSSDHCFAKDEEEAWEALCMGSEGVIFDVSSGRYLFLAEMDQEVEACET